MPRKLTSRAAMRMTVARTPYSVQGSGSPGSGSQGAARRRRLTEPVATQKAAIQAGAATHRTACLAAGPQSEEEEEEEAGMAAVLVDGRWQKLPQWCLQSLTVDGAWPLLRD